MLTRVAATFSVFALTANPVMTSPADYGPFASGQSPARFSLRACPLLAEEGPRVLSGRQVMMYGSDERPAGPRLRTRAADFYSGIEVEVLDAQQRSVAGPRYVSDYPAHSRPESAWCADLNDDGAVDFVLPLWGHGNGLGSLFYELVIVLSSGSRYRMWVVPTAEAGPADFLALPQASCVIVTTSFRSNEEQSERRRHSYWIHNLLAVRNDELIVANQLDRRFPKWVWYTTRPNHKPTASLSPADKERILDLRQESLFREAVSINR
jgi:hypothetical protein